MLSFPDLMESYLQSLAGRPSWIKAKQLMQEWISTLQTTPTRAEILARQRAVCPGGHCSPGATKANKELSFIRAACNWGLYHEVWDGGNPTVGVHKFKTPRRVRIGRQEELRVILHALDFADNLLDRRDRGIIGLQLFTGCRPCEARTSKRSDITKYGKMGCWTKARTKNGEAQYLPIPSQVMHWLEAVEVEEHPKGTPSPYYFTADGERPIHESTYRKSWGLFVKGLQIHGLWAYDLRRTLATYCRRVLKQDDSIIQAILNHYDGRAMAHYVHADFDELAKVIQSYADWLFSLKGGSHADTHGESVPALDRLHGAASRLSGDPNAVLCDATTTASPTR